MATLSFVIVSSAELKVRQVLGLPYKVKIIGETHTTIP